jgi:RecA-family ATPase
MSDKITVVSAEDFEKQFGGDVPGDEFLGFETPKIGMTWGELKTKVFPKSERVIFGLGRGQVGMINASTNIGKTTYALNLGLSLAARANFLPFTEGQTEQLRIMVIDGENTQAELQRDLNTMTRDWSLLGRQLIDENLLLVCDEYINDEPLDLKVPAHMVAVINRAKDFKPDLIIVDTMAALFSLHNENDNAEVKRYVMTPLKILGKEANAAVLLLHHIGKQSEDASAINAAYSGRGGSNFGALSRTVIKLSTPDRNDKSRVVFSVAKSKGFHLPDLMMKLDYDSRWFSVSDEPVPQPVSSYQEVKQFITKEMSTKEIVEHFDGRYKPRTIEQNLKQAVERGEISRVRQGWYAPIDSADSAEPISNGGKCGSDDEIEISSFDNPDDKEFEKKAAKYGF